jgi:hypothetical protein
MNILSFQSLGNNIRNPKHQTNRFAATQHKIEGYTVDELTRNGDQLERVIIQVINQSEREKSEKQVSQLASLFNISAAKPTFRLAIARSIGALVPYNTEARKLLPVIQEGILPILDARIKRMEGRSVPSFELGITLDTLLCFPALIKPKQINQLEEKSAGNVEIQRKISTLKAIVQNAL